jgi:hypothetical protein
MAESFDPKREAALQREKLQIQKEYNEALKLSQSLSSQINSAIESQIDYRTTLGKRVKDYNKDLQSSISQLETSEDVAKKLNEIEQEKLRISNSYRGSNLAMGNAMLASLDIAQQSLAVEHERLVAIERVNDAAEQLTNSMTGALDGFLGKMDEIPIVGGLFKSLLSGPVENMKNGIANAGKTFVTDFAANIRSGVPLMDSLKMAGGNAFGLLRAAINPVVLGILAIGVGIVMAIKRFQEVDAAAKKFRETTGLLSSQTQEVQKNIEVVSRDMVSLGASADDVASSAAAFSKQFGNTQQASRGVLTSMVAMEKSFGVSAESQAAVNEQFQRMAGVSAATAQNMIQTTIQAAKLAGVAPSQVMADIAENSEASYKFFNGSPQALAKAAVEAAKLGTSISKAADVSKGLLNFEDSITKELEASAMLGTRINFNKARALAADKDIIGAQKAVVAEVSKLGDLTKLSTFEQEALAEAAGMPIEDLIRQQQIQQNLGDLDGDRLAAANELIKKGMQISDITDSQLAAEAQRLGQQRDMQSLSENLNNSLSGIGAGFADLFMPVVKFLYPILIDLVDMVSSILLPVFKIVGTILKTTFGILGAILTPVMKVSKALISAVMKPLSSIGEAIAPIGEKFQELSSKIEPYLNPLISVLSSIGNIIGYVIGGAVGLLVDAFVFLFDTAFGVFSSIYNFINTYLIEPILSAINMISGAVSSIGSFLGFGGGEIQAQSGEVTSVNDAVISPDGDVISTSPKDFLIATQNPGELAGAGGKPEWVNELITAFKETKDVYMDGKKVTAGVSNNVDRIGSNSYSIV